MFFRTDSYEGFEVISAIVEFLGRWGPEVPLRSFCLFRPNGKTRGGFPNRARRVGCS